MSDTTLPNGEKRAGDPAFYNNADPSYRPRGPSNESLGKPAESRLENGEGPLPVGEVDVATERRIIRKIDMRIVPMVMWVYLMNMMDRGQSALPSHFRTKTVRQNRHTDFRLFSEHWKRQTIWP